MRNSLFVALLCAVFVFPSAPRDYGQGRPIPPGMREADRQSNAPLEPPAAVKQKTADPAILRQEAAELAQLSASLPTDMGLVVEGQLPKDLQDRLKRIEKLAKHLRSELSR